MKQMCGGSFFAKPKVHHDSVHIASVELERKAAAGHQQCTNTFARSQEVHAKCVCPLFQIVTLIVTAGDS
jgi:hypothetical protein